MNQLIAQLETIADETGEGQQNTAKRAVAGSADEFNRLRQQVGRSVREIRGQLTERDELLQKGMAGTKHAVKISHSVRQQIKLAREDANKLHALQRKGMTKRKANGERVEEQQEVVDLVYKHIEECESLEKKRYTSKQTDHRMELFTSSRGHTNQIGPVLRAGNEGTELPDIETREGLQQLRQKDKQIDQELEQISAGVQDLKNIALDMRDEVTMQTAMVDEIGNKVDKASAHLNTLNKRMKNTLQQTRSADRFIFDFILLVLLLGIIGYIVSMVAG